MSLEFWTETGRMATAGLIVAAAAVPFGLAGWIVALRRGPLLAGWKPWRVPWGGFEAFAAFLLVFFVVSDLILLGLSATGFYSRVYGPAFPRMPTTGTPPVEASAAVAGAPVATIAHEQLETAVILRQLWAGTFALPVQLGLLFLAYRTLYPAWKREPRPPLGPQVALAVAAWAVLTPLVLAFHGGVNFVFTLLEWKPDSHPLTKLAGRPQLDSAVFLFRASVAAPLIEEVLFRGVILAWVVSGHTPGKGGDVPVPVRPWLVALAGVAFAVMSLRTGPIVFAALLIAGLAIVVFRCHSKKRTCQAIYASSTLFALVHSTVWPNPIPLFLLGLCLGWLAVRTRGILVPAIVHGLFNAVSAVYVLRSGAA